LSPKQHERSHLPNKFPKFPNLGNVEM
jgi:hypothetical protein